MAKATSEIDTQTFPRCGQNRRWLGSFEQSRKLETNEERKMMEAVVQGVSQATTVAVGSTLHQSAEEQQDTWGESCRESSWERSRESRRWSKRATRSTNNVQRKITWGTAASSRHRVEAAMRNKRTCGKLHIRFRLQKSRESMTMESRWGPRSKVETRIALKANQRASTEAKDFSKSEIEQGMSCTHSRAWLRSLRRRWPRMALSRTRTPSIQWTALVTSQTTEQVLTRIEDAHNIVDMKYSMFPRSENCSEIQGPTRQHSKLINLLEVEQIYSCANKIDRDTSGSKKSATRSRTRWRACRSRISSKRTPTTRRNVGEHLVIRGDHWEWLRLRARCSASSRGALLQSHPGLCVFSWVPARTPMVHGSPYAGRPCVPDNKSPRDTTKTMTRPSLQRHVWRAPEHKHFALNLFSP